MGFDWIVLGNPLKDWFSAAVMAVAFTVSVTGIKRLFRHRLATLAAGKANGYADLAADLDKPFVVGDFIIVNDYLGSVERIGLKTTRIRSLSGEQLIFSNTDLLNSRIRNFKRMYERRVVFAIGVLYQTEYEKLSRIPDMIRNIIERREPVRFDRAHFKEFGDYALKFEVVYWIQTPDYNVYMDIQQAINLEIHKQFEEAQIGFAYPTRTVFIESQSE